MPFVMDAFNNLFHRKEKSRTLVKSEVNNRRITRKAPVSTGLRCYPFRLGPGVELISTVNELMKELGIESMFILSCHGNLSHCSLNHRQLNKKEYEILSLNGSFDRANYSLMGSFADCQTGSVIGGRVHSLTVSTSCELILAEPLDCQLNRELDPRTGNYELSVRRKQIDDL